MGFMRDICGSFNINPLFSPCSNLSGDTNSSVRPNFSSIFPKIFNLQMCYCHSVLMRSGERLVSSIINLY